MRTLEFYDNIELGIVNQYNDETAIKVVCSICGENKFNLKKFQPNCEFSYIELNTECTSCGKLEKYKYIPNKFISDFPKYGVKI